MADPAQPNHPANAQLNVTRRTWVSGAAFAWAMVCVGARPARAATFEGVQFDDRITLAGRELLLNGTGLRAAGWFKAYVAALYLPRRAGTAVEVLEQAGPKRVRLVLLVDAPAVELAKGFDKGVKRNSGAEVEALRVRLARMFELMDSVGKVHKGDAVDLDFDPARGTTLALNGQARGEPITGNDFYVAVLRSFVGDHPYHKKLKSGLLGTPA